MPRQKSMAGVNRGKRYGRASYSANHNGRDTHKRAAAPRRQSRKSQWQGHTQESRRPKASIVASATAEPPIECKSQWQGHTQESRRPKASIAQITMAGTHTREPAPQGVNRGKRCSKANGRNTHKRTGAPRRQSWQEQQQSLL